MTSLPKNLVPLSRRLRNDMTRAEGLLWHDLRELKQIGFHFRRQAPIGDYIVDFVCHRAKVVIELDGDHHGHEEQRNNDMVRDRWLESQGYTVRRYWNDEIYTNRDYVMDHLIHDLEKRRTDE